MVNFDVRILLIVVAILLSILGLHLLNLRKINSSSKSPVYWAIGSFAAALSLLSLSIFPWPAEIIGFIIFNLLIIMAQCFHLYGIWAFKGKKHTYALLITMGLFSLLQILFFTKIHSQPGARMAINSLLFAILAFYSFYEMIRPFQKVYTFVFRTNAFVLFLFGSLMLFRAYFAHNIPAKDYASLQPINLLFFIVIAALQVVLVYGFIVMLNTQLSESLKSQLAVRQRLISIIGHDLKSSINVVGGFSDLLNRNIEKLEIEKSKQFAGYIKQASIQMNALLTNLLDWAKIQSNSENFFPEKLDICEVIDDEIAINSSVALNKNIGIIYNDTQSLYIQGDRNMLKTILRNLIINAIKYTNPGGSIKIGARQNGSFVEVYVQDSGIGIEPDILRKLFQTNEPITSEGTAKETGSGLGLMLCKEFVHKHKGEIWAESKVEQGSVFYFTIPRLHPTN